jgi:glycosyltransferase involved in cell wall biosynthesis
MVFVFNDKEKVCKSMKLQVLVAAMNQTDHSLPQKMNIKCDAIIGNQCDLNAIEDTMWQGHKIKYLHFSERGVGLNRNNALMRADADIVLFADDDMVYCNDYIETIISAFNKHSDADVIIFNIKEKHPTRYIIKKTERVWYHNYLRYGTARVAVRLKSVRENGICFNLCYGGGTEHCHGEDNIFLTDCLKKGLKIYAVPQYIAKLTEERASTWNNGYDEKYIRDQGCLYKAISKKWWKLLCLQDVIRRSKRDYKMSWFDAYKKMIGV